MKKIHYILLLVVIAFSTVSFSQNSERKVEVEICNWYENKSGAISVSFDDASYGQYQYALPIMEKYGIKGTFSLVGEWTKVAPTFSAELGAFNIKKMCWDNIREIHKKGHEIAAHGYSHTRYDGSKSKQELVLEMKKIKNLIETKIKSPVYTSQYPYSHTTKKIYEATKEAGFLFGRTADDSLNTISPPNLFGLASQPIINNDSPSEDEFKSWINKTDNKWLVVMYHHIFTDSSKEMRILRYHKIKYTHALLPKNFDKQMKMVSKSSYWKAPISSVGKYVKERDNTKISAFRYKKKIIVNSTTNLDKIIYNHPITIKIKVPWKKVKVEGSEKDGIFKVKGDYLYINVLPESLIVISKKCSL